PELCSRYIGHVVSDIEIAPSPAWMRKRLAVSGIRSISNIVDITNFVLLEMGQPMHAFDLDDLTEKAIHVRRAKEGETIVTLDDKQFTLNQSHLLLCDGDRPVALAGIMGGKNSEIKDTTKDVFFECARFARDSVRKTSRALGQRSDSSARYEKGVDEYTTECGLSRALHLIEELGCGKVSTWHVDADVDPNDSCGRALNVSISKINALLGITVPTEEMVSILQSLQFSVTVNGDTLELIVPAYRDDIDGMPDIAEEIIRMYGYDHIKPTFLKAATVTSGGLNESQKLLNQVKQALRAQGYHEALTYSFYSPKAFDLLKLPQDAPERRAIRILNPLGEDLSVMRTILIPSMIDNVVRNVRRGNERGKLFEVSNVYLPKELPLSDYPEEKNHIVIGAWGEGDFFDLKGAVETLAETLGVKLSYSADSLPFLHPGATAKIYLGEKEVGFIGELAPDVAASLAIEKKVYLAELDYAFLEKKVKAFRYQPLPKFPVVERDLALVTEETVTCAQIEEVVCRACKAVTKIELFDVYRSAQIGEGKKSLAFHLTFTPDEKELTPETVDKLVKKILDALEHRLGIVIR
ncbi:MAG: phenylalanine--tRNA ligase subunit beta, partial [Christensenellaceae bacterium]